MQKFKLSWMALLRNDEHAQLIEQLCGILDDCPIDNPYVTKAAAKVKSHLPALRCVGSVSRKHELTAVLDELSEKTPSNVDLARHAGEGGLVVASARGK